MTFRLSKLGVTGALAALIAGSSFSTARADDNTGLLKDAHKELSLALNIGGDTPSDADRTADVNAALTDLKDASFASSRAEWVKSVAMKDLKTALDQISRGDPDHEASKKIRDADSIVRDLES